jgi:hypothetical protein
MRETVSTRIKASREANVLVRFDHVARTIVNESPHHVNGCETSRSRFQSIIYPRSRHAENITRASLLDVDLTHPFLLANDLDLIT